MILSKCKPFTRFARAPTTRAYATYSGIGDPFSWDHGSDWTDFFRIDSLLSDDERMIRYGIGLTNHDIALIEILQDILLRNRFSRASQRHSGMRNSTNLYTSKWVI